MPPKWNSPSRRRARGGAGYAWPTPPPGRRPTGIAGRRATRTPWDPPTGSIPIPWLSCRKPAKALKPSLEFLLQMGQGHGPGDAVRLPPALEQDQGGNAADLVAAGQVRFQVRIHLDHRDPAFPFLGQL